MREKMLVVLFYAAVLIPALVLGTIGQIYIHTDWGFVLGSGVWVLVIAVVSIIWGDWGNH